MILSGHDSVVFVSALAFRALLPLTSLHFWPTLYPVCEQEIKHPDKEKSTGAYSAAVEVDGWVYVSGQGPVTLKRPSPSAAPSRKNRNDSPPRRENSCAAGCSSTDIVKCTVHLADIEDFDRFNATLPRFFKGASVLPARTTVQSVLWDAIKVEIDCVARSRLRSAYEHIFRSARKRRTQLATRMAALGVREADIEESSSGPAGTAARM